MSYEEKFSELLKIVDKLENSKPELQESIELYKKGMCLSAECKKMLNDAKLTVMEYSADEK